MTTWEQTQSDSVGVIFHKQFEFLMGAIFPDPIFFLSNFPPHGQHTYTNGTCVHFTIVFGVVLYYVCTHCYLTFFTLLQRDTET